MVLHERVDLSQRMLDIVKNMHPGDWGAYRRWQNEIAAHQYDCGSTPLDGPWQALVKFIAPGGIDRQLAELVTDYQSLKANNDYKPAPTYFSGDFDTELPRTLETFNLDSKAAFVSAINQAIANGYVVPDDWLNDATSFAANIRDHGP